MTSDEQYVPDEQDLEVAWIESEASADDINVASAEFDRFLARARRDAARDALDGLIEDAEIDVRLGVEGGDNLRVQNAEAAIDAATIYRDTEYPEEAP